MSRRPNEVPGNAMESARLYANELARVAELCFEMDKILARLDERDVWVKALRFRAPSDIGTEWLAIVTAHGPEGDAVGFHAAPTFQECLKGTLERLRNGSFKWKADKPYGD